MRRATIAEVRTLAAEAGSLLEAKADVTFSGPSDVQFLLDGFTLARGTITQVADWLTVYIKGVEAGRRYGRFGGGSLSKTPGRPAWHRGSDFPNGYSRSRVEFLLTEFYRGESHGTLKAIDHDELIVTVREGPRYRGRLVVFPFRIENGYLVHRGRKQKL